MLIKGNMQAKIRYRDYNLEHNVAAIEKGAHRVDDAPLFEVELFSF